MALSQLMLYVSKPNYAEYIPYYKGLRQTPLDSTPPSGDHSKFTYSSNMRTRARKMALTICQELIAVLRA